MHTVGAFDHVQPLRRKQLRLLQGKRGAVKAAVQDFPADSQRRSHFFPEPLVVDVSTGLSHPLRRPLLPAQVKVVHMEQTAVELLHQPGSQRRLSGAASPVDRNDDPLPVTGKKCPDSFPDFVIAFRNF